MKDRNYSADRGIVPRDKKVGVTSDTNEIEKEFFRLHVPESFNIYHGTLTQISIMAAMAFAAYVFTIFHFSNLPAFGWGWKSLMGFFAPRVPIYLLGVASVSLLGAMVCFHKTAHQVIRRYRIMMPHSKHRLIGTTFMNVGIWFVCAFTSYIPLFHGMYILTALLAAMSIYIGSLRPPRTHNSGTAEYMAKTD